MIIAYLPTDRGMERVIVENLSRIPTTSIWVDLFNPTVEERDAVEKFMCAQIPTREEMTSIETSERLYEEPGALVMTAILPMAAREADISQCAVTFVLNNRHLVTVRYGEPLSISTGEKRAQADPSVPHTGPGVMFMLLDAITARAADVTEACSYDFDNISMRVFEKGLSSRKSEDYKTVIQTIGRLGLKVARMHECCTSISRMLLFLSLNCKQAALTEQQILASKSLTRDIHSVKEHADAIDAKLNFLLDATVGLVNLEQNQIIKIFSVLAVIFLPPTLIASIYGMNFINMPELQWTYGYPFSIVVMFASVLATFLYFRWQKLL